jgi:thiamine-monophosphate kinase
MVEEIYGGIAQSMKQFGYHVIGGDTTGSTGNMTVSVAMTGEAVEDQVFARDGAVPGDYLCVSGHLGASIAGLKILQREKSRYLSGEGKPESFKPNLEPYTGALAKHLMPAPRLDLIPLLGGKIRVTAMIDISDALASEVHHICELSGTGAAVYERNLPVDGVTQKIAAELGESPTGYALYGGEEYELLFTLSDGEYEKLESVTSDVTVVGRIQEKEKGIVCVSEQGETRALPKKGWDHFSAGKGPDGGPAGTPGK